MKKNKPIEGQKKNLAKAKQQKDNNSLSATGAIVKNGIILIVLLNLAVVLTREGKVYHWFYNDLIKKNLEFAFGKNGDLTKDDKYNSKFQFTYVYLNHLKKRTPEDAIIILPDSEVFMKKNATQKFNTNINKKGFVSFFLYPRKVVYESEKDQNVLYKQATHIAIVNEWGYSRLPYQTSSRPEYTVLPLKYPGKEIIPTDRNLNK